MRARHRDGAARFAARRQREIDAPKLTEEVPSLATLRMEVTELGGTGTILESKHVRLVVVGSAPALFLVPCGDPACKEGGHDITREVVNHLKRSDASFEIEDGCPGTTGTANCSRIIKVKAEATYDPSATPAR